MFFCMGCVAAVVLFDRGENVMVKSIKPLALIWRKGAEDRRTS
jgi:hypothetical protein